jgi:hypothetical protein
MTLTFKGYPSNKEAKRCFHAFLQILYRKFSQASAVWRVEYQTRGSLHFHILAFNLPYWDWKEILKAWKRITHQIVARIDVRLVRSRRGVMFYISKYIAKVEKRHGKTFFIQAPYLHGYKKWRKGRFWGYHNKKYLPLGEKLAGILKDDKLIKKLSNAAWEQIGTGTRYNSISFTLFTDSARALWIRYIKLGGMTIDEWANSQQITRWQYKTDAWFDRRFSSDDLKIPKVSALGKMSRANEVSAFQPCTSDWLRRSSRVDRLTGELY